MDISYQEAYTMNKEEARRLIIETYLDTGNFSLTARLWRTSFSPVILDTISINWLLETGNDLLAHYNSSLYISRVKYY